MNYRRHYKDKPYRVRGVARHSETLEEHVIYEPMYAGSPADLWVRPRAMFEDDVEVEGRKVPRFANVPLRIETFDHVGATELGLLAPMACARNFAASASPATS